MKPEPPRQWLPSDAGHVTTQTRVLPFSRKTATTSTTSERGFRLGRLCPALRRLARRARIYQVSLNDGVWKLWREAFGFWQRCTGVFTGDGSTVKGAWEGSAEGSQRKRNRDLNYVRPRVARRRPGLEPAATPTAAKG
jgi:hypothetical protein